MPGFTGGLYFNLICETRQEMGTLKLNEIAVREAGLEERPMEPKKKKRRKPRANPSRPPLTKEQQDLAVQYLPLARSLAKRFKEAWVFESDEFESAACLALVEAAQSYDAAKNVKFATYARKRILGELRDVQRELVLPGWTHNMEEAPDLLPLIPDVEAYGRVLMSEPDSPVHEDLEAHERLESLIQRLPGKHAATCREIYVGGLSQAETGVALGMSQTRICILHKQSMEMLNEALAFTKPIEDETALRKPPLPPGAPADLDKP
jgi:RNA polymerase sigma factor (sigma-70 family)